MWVNDQNRNLGVFKRIHEGILKMLSCLCSSHEVNLFLSFSHWFDIIVQWNGLSFLSNWRSVTAYSKKLLLVLTILHYTFLDKHIEILVPKIVTLRVLLHFIFNELKYTPSDHILQFWNEIGVLIGFTRNVKWKILTINNTLDESKIPWNELCAIILDQNFSWV